MEAWELRRVVRELFVAKCVPFSDALPYLSDYNPEDAAGDAFKEALFVDRGMKIASKLLIESLPEGHPLRRQMTPERAAQVLGNTGSRRLGQNEVTMPKSPSPFPKTGASVQAEIIPPAVDELTGKPDKPATPITDLKTATADLDLADESAPPAKPELEVQKPAEPAAPVQDTKADLSKTAQERVAEILNEAFPDKDKAWKLNFFQIKIGHMTFDGAIKALSEAIMFAQLRDAINVELGKDKPQAEPPAAPKTEIVISKPTAVAIPSEERALGLSALGLPNAEDFGMMQQFAKFVAATKFWKNVDTEARAMILFWKGANLGITMISALDMIHVIPGKDGEVKLVPSSPLMKALADKSGLLEKFDIQARETGCTVTIKRKDRPTANTYSYTLDDARANGLLETYGDGNLKRKAWNNPRRMCTYRAVWTGVNIECPEVLVNFPDATPDRYEEVDAAA